MDRCPCQSQLITYKDCCEPFHKGQACPDARSLMRSRYSAYVLKLESYLLKTWHPSTRPKKLSLAQDTQLKWQGLELLAFEELSKDEAIVEFIARYQQALKNEKLHEVSHFVFEKGYWYYVEGKIR
jgi:SEC-C motif-containing protein